LCSNLVTSPICTQVVIPSGGPRRLPSAAEGSLRESNLIHKLRLVVMPRAVFARGICFFVKRLAISATEQFLILSSRAEARVFCGPPWRIRGKIAEPPHAFVIGCTWQLAPRSPIIHSLRKIFWLSVFFGCTIRPVLPGGFLVQRSPFEFPRSALRSRPPDSSGETFSGVMGLLH
jgi:hypothetical protein